MEIVLLDTDVLIDFVNGAEPSAVTVRTLIQGRRGAMSAVSRFELQSGARSSQRKKALTPVLAFLPVLPLDARSADYAASVRERLEQAGYGIGMADSLIAGIALANNVPLFTRNRRHFERVEGLRLWD